MNFFWSEAGHIGWPLFAVLVTTGVFVLAFDYAWRLVNIRTIYLVAGFAVVWTACQVLIVLYGWV